jgi:hypothetical protein
MVRGQPQTHERRFSESLKVASKFPIQVAWAKNAGQGSSFEEARATSSIQFNGFIPFAD